MKNNDGFKLTNDLVCLSHLRWGFVYQRPQHLMSRFARHQRVFFVEEPLSAEGGPARMDVRQCPESGVFVATPRIEEGLSPETVNTTQKLLLNNLVREYNIDDFTLWYYTPMALAFSAHVQPDLVVFDCMDELSAFKFAPQEMRDREAEVLRRAHLVFTGGQSLYEAKKDRHPDIHAFPSSVDVAHFKQAREIYTDPVDQASIAHPRIGYCGVIDERLDYTLIAEVAALRPLWNLVMIGPVVKVDPASLPQAPNIHYLGGKNYKELPQYMAGWDVAMLPFAHNDSTRFISPTKTPEYLSAGCPVVSTSITDVVRPYGLQGIVRIADTAEDFVAAAESAMEEEAHDRNWLARVDEMLARNSWDDTWRRMAQLMESRLERARSRPLRREAGRQAVGVIVSGD